MNILRKHWKKISFSICTALGLGMLTNYSDKSETNTSEDE